MGPKILRHQSSLSILIKVIIVIFILTFQVVSIDVIHKSVVFICFGISGMCILIIPILYWMTVFIIQNSFLIVNVFVYHDKSICHCIIDIYYSRKGCIKDTFICQLPLVHTAFSCGNNSINTTVCLSVPDYVSDFYSRNSCLRILLVSF